MIVKFLGTIDILIAILFWVSYFDWISTSILLILAFYLLIKGIIFLTSGDIASILDIICAGLIFLAISFNLPFIIISLVSIFLIQKGIFSILA